MIPQKLFLQAAWKNLIFANYLINPFALKKYVPAGTELDFWKDQCYVSIVGFQFLQTRVMGFKIPFHVNFDEVNLRFYVRRKKNDQWKRGVVFAKEIVPKAAIAIAANMIYGENYIFLPMRHIVEAGNNMNIR